MFQKIIAWCIGKKLIKCGRCMWWCHEENAYGRCHKSSPGIWHYGDLVVTEFPKVSAIDWCGDAKPVSDAEVRIRLDKIKAAKQ